jgi:hypothetical protein
MRFAIFIFVLALSAQAGFWWKTREITPELTIVPDVPGEATVKALSLGDEEALFRLLALNVQNAGDTYGRFTALYKYDFNRLYHWFLLLDTLDNRSDFVPTLATYYFSQTQHKPDVKYIVDYLESHTKDRIKEKWWWVVQAIYLSSHKLKDNDRALALAKQLEGHTDIPLWAQQMPAFVHEQRGEMEAASAIIESILQSEQQLNQGELNFMYYFLKERTEQLDKYQAELLKAQQRHTPSENEPAPVPALRVKK